MSNLALINKRLNELIKDQGPKELLNAAFYAINTTAKRMRPLLTLTIIELLKKNSKIGLDAACAIEFVHTYSLIHDDLPCMDDDDFRREKPSLHKAFNEWLALLTGNFFLTYAFTILANIKNISLTHRLKLISLLSKYSGGTGMLGGQVLDMMVDKTTSENTLKHIYLGKTAALIIAAIEFGCIIANADAKTTKILKSFGGKFGLIYQIVDDFHDVKASKISLVSLLGQKKAYNLIQKLYISALKDLKFLPFSTQILIDIARKVIDQFPKSAV